MAVNIRFGCSATGKNDTIHNELILVLSKLGVLTDQETALAERGQNIIYIPGSYRHSVIIDNIGE